MKCSVKIILGKNVVVLNSNLRFIYKDSADLKMCFADFGDMCSRRSLLLMYPAESSLNSASPSDVCRWL